MNAFWSDPRLFPGTAAALGALMLWGGAAFGLGTLIPGLRRSDPLVKFALGVLGLGIIGVVAPRAGLALPRWLWTALLALPFSIAAVHCRRRLRLSWPGLVLALFAVFTLGSALLPPVGWDEQVYQAALPRLYLESGDAAVRLDNPYSAYPSLPHFTLLGALKIGGLLVPRLAVWLLTLLLAAAVYRRCRRSGRPAALVLTVIGFATPLALTVIRESYAESFVALFTVAGWFAALRHSSRRSAVLSGLCAGAALAVKLTGGAAALALLVLNLKDVRSRRHLIWFAAAAGLAAAPFFWRIHHCTGDWFYPFGALLAGGPPDQLRVAEFHRMLGSFRYGLGVLPGITVGWLVAAVDGRAFDGITLGLQTVMLVLIAAIGARRAIRNSSAGAIRTWLIPALAGAAFYGFWAVTGQQTRFLYPLLLLLITGAAAGLAELRHRRSFLAAAIVGAALSFAPPMFGHFINAWRWLPLVPEHPGAYLAGAGRDPGYAEAVEQLWKLPEHGGRVLLFMERRTLFAPPGCRIFSPYFNAASARMPDSSAELRQRLKDYDHLLVGSGLTDLDAQAAVRPEQEKLISQLGELVQSGGLSPLPLPSGRGDYLILRINAPDATGATCSTSSTN